MYLGPEFWDKFPARFFARGLQKNFFFPPVFLRKFSKSHGVWRVVCCGGRPPPTVTAHGVDARPTPIMPSVEEFFIDSVDSVFVRNSNTGS
jgi:hypothetical protein